ncbi:MAG: hypothetical protein HY738_05080 [Bacteroidia bacterium]|nr:hypothetical protein [Bacteroidia bacterium]
MRKGDSNLSVFVWRWTFVLFILAASFWLGVYFITGSAPIVRYAFIEHYMMYNGLITNISLYKFFLLDKIFPVFVPFAKYDQILVAQLPFILPRWCDALLVPVFLPLICFIFKKEYFEVNKITNINDDDEDSFINSLYRGRYSFYIIMASLSLIYIVTSIIAYPPQNADIGTYTSDIKFWAESSIQLAFIIFATLGGIVNGVVIGFLFSRVKPARTLPVSPLFVLCVSMSLYMILRGNFVTAILILSIGALAQISSVFIGYSSKVKVKVKVKPKTAALTLPISLLFVFCLSMLLAGLGGGIVQGLVTAILVTLSHFYACVLMLIVIFIDLSIKKVFISILNASQVLALRRWLGID